MGHRQLQEGRAGDLGMEVDEVDLGQPGQGKLTCQGFGLDSVTIEACMNWRRVGVALAYGHENRFGQAFSVSY